MMPGWMNPWRVRPPRPSRAGPSDLVRRDIAPLLAGYWAFGQFWGVWVILVFEFQRHHGITDAGWACTTRCCP